MMSLPNELRYTKEHEWVKIEGENVKIGITDFAQSELGDVVFVELPEEGEEIEVNSPFGSVESVKTVSELYAPVSGTIIEVNEALEDSPEFVNEDPYDKAWMIILKPADKNQLDQLLSAEEYQAILSED